MEEKNYSLLKEYLSKIAGGGVKNSRTRNILLTLLSILLVSGILGYLIYSQWAVLVEYEWEIRLLPLGLAFFVHFVIMLLNTTVWISIIRQLGTKQKFWIHFLFTTISALGKRLPGTIWYVFWRMELYREDLSAKKIALASWIEMAVTIVAAVILCAIFAVPQIIEFQYSIFVIAFLLGLSVAALHPKSLKGVLKKIGYEEIQINSRYYFYWIGMYAIIWCLVGLLLYLIANIFVPVTMDQIPYFIGSVALTGVLSRLFLLAPSSFGITEVGLSVLLAKIIPSSLAVVIAILNRIIIIFFEIIWAVLSLLIIKRLNPGLINPNELPEIINNPVNTP